MFIAIIGSSLANSLKTQKSKQGEGVEDMESPGVAKK